MSKKKSLIISGAILSITLASVVSAAPDRKTMPGAACQPANQTSAISRNGISGKLHNNSTSTQTWVCPIVRDQSKKSIASARVRVVDQHYSVDIKCRLHNRSPGNGAGYVSGWVYSSGSNSATQTLTFGALAAYNGGTHHFECSIPGKFNSVKSSISAYDVSENT